MEKSTDTTKKNGLGKGLNSLMGLDHHGSGSDSTLVNSMIELPIDDVKPNPNQPRKLFHEEELSSLSKSIEEHGVMQPIIVSKTNRNEYLIVAGERRWRASKRAGLKTVPALVKDVTPKDILSLALIENIQRSDLNVIEEAEAYAALIEEFGMTQEECAKKMGKDRASISNTLRLLHLPKEVQDDLFTNKLTMGHGRALAGLQDKNLTIKIRDVIVKKQLNVRQTERLIKKLKTQSESSQQGAIFGSDSNRDLDYLADSLRSHLRTKVRLNGNGARGKIEISYFSASELERLLKIIGGREMGL